MSRFREWSAREGGTDVTNLYIRRGLLVLSIAAGAAGATLASSEASATVRIIIGVDLTVTCIQAKKENKDTVTTDPRISRQMRSFLIATFGLRYKNYTFVKEQENLLSWTGKPNQGKDNQDSSKRASFDVGTGKQLFITYLGFRRYVINFQFQYGTNFDLVDIDSDTFYLMKANEEADPLLVIVRPKLVEIWR
jgi:hypothetical protein